MSRREMACGKPEDVCDHDNHYPERAGMLKAHIEIAIINLENDVALYPDLKSLQWAVRNEIASLRKTLAQDTETERTDAQRRSFIE